MKKNIARLLDQLIKTVEDLDMQSFSTHCYEYDKVSKNNDEKRRREEKNMWYSTSQFLGF